MTSLKLLALLLLVTATRVRAENWTLKIFHINDLHYDIFEVKHDNSIDCAEDEACFGGLQRLKQLVDADILSEAPPNTSHLWLNAGNVLRGPTYDVLKFDIASAVHNLSFHASALGADAFKYGSDPAESYTQPLNDSLVAANIAPEAGLLKSLLIPINEACHAAVVGFVDKDKTEALHVFGLQVEDEVSAVTAEIAAVRAAHSDKKLLFIALGSASLEGAKKIAGNPDVDIVVFSGGDLANATQVNLLESVKVEVNSSFTKTNYVISVIKNMAELDKRFLVGTLEVAIDDMCRLTAQAPVAAVVDYLNNNKTEDEDMDRFIHASLDRMLSLDETIAQSKMTLLPSVDECKKQECAVGDLITDAMVDRVTELTADTPWAESVKVAVFPASLIQNQMNVTGVITPQDLRSFFLQDEFIYTLPMSGKTMKRMFDASIVEDDGNDVMKNYLQVSEYFHVEFNHNSNSAVLIETVVGDAATLTAVDVHDDTSSYLVAVPGSMLYNMTAFDFLRDLQGVQFYDASVADALISHVSRTTGGYLTLPLTGLRTLEDSSVPQLCVSNTGEVIILTLFVLALIVAFVIGLWKYVLPKYRNRRGSTTQLIP